jgi:hypothetical protein
MNERKEFEQALRTELKDILPNTIWRNIDGVYSVFGKYRIEPINRRYCVYVHATEVGTFNTTRTALSWCIADKFHKYSLAREILETDVKLGHLHNDISTRASLADRSTKPEFRESIGAKLETKIIRKKILENRLTECTNSAKYLQQQGFNNETARTGRNQPNKTSR